MVTNAETENVSKVEKIAKDGLHKIDLSATVTTILVLAIVLYVSSLVWFLFLLIVKPKKAAEFYNNFGNHLSFSESFEQSSAPTSADDTPPKSQSDTLFNLKKIWSFTWDKVSTLFNFTWYYLWMPIIYILPMSVKRHFIETSALGEHSIQTQMDYVIYQLKHAKGLPSSISEESEVFTALWYAADETERNLFRNAWIAAGKVIKDEQITHLIESDSDAAAKTLLSYFTLKTRKEEQLYLLIEKAKDARICDIICKICQQQKPTTKFIELLFTSDNDKLHQQMIPIIDECADNNAVNKLPQAKSWDEESEPDVVKEWRKFCTYKTDISPSAQAKMAVWQYEIFAKTNHRLSKSALLHLLATQSSPDYLIKIIEYEGIATVEDTCVLAILKSRPEFYDAYIGKKLELQEATKVGKV